jgi:hypothetical protein
LGTAVLLTTFTACNNSDNVRKDVENLSQYVDSVDEMEPVYTEAKWANIEEGYKDRNAQVEKNKQLLKSGDEEKVAASKTKFAVLEMRYKSKMAEAKKPDYRVALRSNLFGEGKIGTDMQFNWVTADNIKDVYEKFVNTVEDHKNDYSREDWDEIKLLYEALDNRKNEVEKHLATRDNLKIAELKVKFSVIKSVHRPIAKAEENNKAKD